MLSIIKPRGDIKANWESNNPVLRVREWGVEWETTVGVGEVKIKIGDGINPWNNLDYAIVNNITKKTVSTFATVVGENPELSEGSSMDVLWAVTKKKFENIKTQIETINTMIGVFKNITIDSGGNTEEAVTSITDAIQKLNTGKLTVADIYDGVDSTNSQLALSANRGRLFNEALNSLNGNLSQNAGVYTYYDTPQECMDGIYNWILSVPKFVMNTKFISCGYTASSEAFNLSGELYGGPFLLIGFRSSIYASITAHSYWKDRAISVATIENGIWAKRFEKLITNNDFDANNNGYIAFLKQQWANFPVSSNASNLEYINIEVGGPIVNALYYKHTGGSYGWAILCSYDHGLARPLYIRIVDGVWQNAYYL